MATEAETKEPMPEHEKIVGGKLENERHLTGNGTNSEEVSEVKVETEMEAAEKHAMDINEKITADKTTFKDITDVTEAHTEEKGNKSHDETVPTDKLEEEEIESKNGNLKDENLNSSISGTKQSEKENTNGPTEINTSNILKRGTTEQEEENLKKVIEGKEVEIQAGDIKMQGVESISITEPTEVEQKPDTNVLACQESEDDNQNEDDENGKGGNESNINIGVFESPQILQETSDREDVSRTKNEREIDDTINYQSTTEENVQTEKTDIDNQELDVEAVEFDKEYQKAMSEDKEVLIEDQLNNDTCATEIAEVNNAENGSSETSRMNLDGDVGENDCQLESEGKFESFDVYEIAKEAEETVPKEETKESILEGSSTTMEETSVKEDEENIEESKDTPTSTKTTQVEYVQENGINSSFDDQTSASISLSDGLNQDDQKDKQDESTSFKIGNEMQTEPKLYETNDTSEASGSNSFKDKGSMERNTENSVVNKLQQNSSDVFLDSLSAELETETEGETPNKETVKEGISNPSTGAPSIFAVEVSKDKGEEINAVDTETGDSDLATLDETISSEKALQEMNISDDHEYKEKKLETILLKEELEDKSIKKETGTGAEPVFYEASETMETNENEVFKESVAAERNVEKEISDDPHFHENTAEAEDTRANEMEKEGLKAEKDKESDDEDLKDTISNIGENSNVHESPALITDEMDGADLQIADDLIKKPEKEEAVNVTVEKDIDESLIVEKEITGASKDTSLKAGTATENECKEKHEIKASSENKELEDEQLEIENIIQTKQESFNASNADETKENEGFQGKEFTEENISEKEILEYMEHEKSPHVVLEDLETTETKDIQDIETENQGINNNEDNAKKIEASVHSNTEAIPSNSTLKEEIEQLANQLPEREEATNITTEKDNLTELVPQLPNEAADSDALLKFDSESEKNRNIDTNLEKEKFEDTAQEKENDKLELPQSHVANGASELDDIIILKENEIADKENCSTKNFSQYEDTIIVEPITESEPEIQSCSSITIAKGGHPSEEDYKEEAVAAEDDHLQEQMIEKEEKDDMYEEGKEGRSIEETNITENIIKEELDVHTRLEEEQKEERHIENEMLAEKTTYKSCDVSESNANESNKEKETADNDMLTIERTNESENVPEVNIITENIIKEEGDFHTRLQEEEQNEALHTENEMLVENTTYESCDASESNKNESIKEKERAEKYIVNPEGREIKTAAENIRESEIIDTHANNEDNLQSNEDVIPETEIDSDDQNTNSILSEKARETESAPQINIETPCDTMDETYVSHDKEMQNDFEAVEEKIHSRVDVMHVSENDEEKKEPHSSLQNKELEHETHTEQELYEASKSSETNENEIFEYNENTEKIDSEEYKLEGKEPDTSSHVSFENFDALAENKDCNHIEPEKQETVTIHEANFDKGEENVTVEESKFGIQRVNHYEDTINEENATPEHLSHQTAEKEATNSTDQGTTAEIKSSNEKEIEETDLSEYDKVDKIDNINEIETEKQDAQIDDEHNLQKGEDVMLVKSTTEASKEDILDACPEALSKIKNEPIEAQIVKAKAINDKDEEVKDVKLVSQEDTKYVQVEEKIHCTQEENSKVLADLEKDNKENRDNSASLQKEELDENPIKDLDGNPRDRKEENEQQQTEQICFESCNSSNIYDNESFPENGSVSEEELKDQKPENIAILVPEDLNATPESTIEKETTEFNDEKRVQKKDTMLVESAIIEKSGNESNTFVCGTNGASTFEEAKDDELASQIDVEMTHANALNGNEDPLHKNIENDNRVFDEKIISEASDGHENQSSKERDLIVVESAKIATVSEEKDQDEEQLEENEMINGNMNNVKMQGPQVQDESLALEIDGKMEQSESTNKMGMENTEINTALSKDDKIETVNTKLLNEDKAELDADADADADAVPVDRVKENTDQLTKQNNMLSDNIEMETDDSFSKISNYWPINYNEVVNVNKMETVKLDEKTESSQQLVHDKDMLQEQSLQEPELNQSKQVIETEQLIDTKASPEVENDSIQEENLPFSQFLMKHILMNESDSLKTSYDEEIVDKQDDIDISKEDEKLGPSSVVEQIHHASIADDSAGFHEKLQENNEVQVDDRCDVNDISEAIDNKRDLLTNELPISAVEQTQSTSIVEDKTTNKKPQENKEVQADDNCDVKDNSEVIDNKLETFTMEFPISVAEQTQCTSIVDDKAINEKPQENKEIQVDDKCDVKDNSEFTDNKKEIFTTQLPTSVIEQAQHTSIAEDKAYNEMPQENNEVQLDNKCDVIDVSEVVDDEKEFSTMELPIAVDDSMREHEFDSCIHNEADMQNDVDALKQEDLLVHMPKVQQNGKPKDNAVPERLPNSYDPVQAEKSYGVASDSETNFVRNEDKEENISKTLSEKSIPAIKDQEDIELISTDREIKEDNPNLVMVEQTSEKSLDDTIAEKKILHKKDCNELKAENSEIIEEEKQEQMLKNGVKDEITVAGLQKDQQTNLGVEPEAALGENNLERNQDINIYEKENEKEQKKFEAPTLSEDKVNSEIKPVENVEDNQDILNQKSDSTEELTLLESQKAQEVDDNNTDDDEDENQEVDEHKGDDSNHDETINVESRDMNVTPTKKKSHGLLSGVGSKVKRSIIKVKKAITGKSSHSDTQSVK